jgi:hypothetical protein
MIDWHHPRIYERLRCFGLALFTLGIASHNVDTPAIALAALSVTTMLIYRLKLELAIAHTKTKRSWRRSFTGFSGSISGCCFQSCSAV